MTINAYTAVGGFFTVTLFVLAYLFARGAVIQRESYTATKTAVDTSSLPATGAISGTVTTTTDNYIEPILHTGSKPVAVQQTIERPVDEYMGSWQIDSQITHTIPFTIGTTLTGLIPESYDDEPEGEDGVTFSLTRDAISNRMEKQRIKADKFTPPNTHPVNLDDAAVVTYRVGEYIVEPGDTVTVAGTWRAPTDDEEDVDVVLDTDAVPAEIGFGEPKEMARSVLMKMVFSASVALFFTSIGAGLLWLLLRSL